MFIYSFPFQPRVIPNSAEAVVGLSDASAIGVDSRQEDEVQWAELANLEKPCQHTPEQEAIEERLESDKDISAKKDNETKKQVKFKEDSNLSSHFDDKDLWAHG